MLEFYELNDIYKSCQIIDRESGAYSSDKYYMRRIKHIGILIKTHKQILKTESKLEKDRINNFDNISKRDISNEVNIICREVSLQMKEAKLSNNNKLISELNKIIKYTKENTLSESNRDKTSNNIEYLTRFRIEFSSPMRIEENDFWDARSKGINTVKSRYVVYSKGVYKEVTKKSIIEYAEYLKRLLKEYKVGERP